MAKRRRAHRSVKRTEPYRTGSENPREPQFLTQGAEFIDIEIQGQRQIDAIRAVRDVEIEHLLTELRLLRSYFNNELLRIPVVRFFEENFPHLLVVYDRENEKFEVRTNDKDSIFSMSYADQRDVHTSFLQRLSIAYRGGYEYSSKSGRTSLLGDDNLYINELVWQEPSETQTLIMQDILQTPGVSTQRLPKPGEMLLSVHGSPLAVYKGNSNTWGMLNAC